MRLSAAVVAPLDVPARDLFVRQPLPVGGKRAAQRVGNWQALGHAPGRGDRPELLDPHRRCADAGGAEQDPFRVGRPGARDVRPRVPRQTPRLAARSVDHVDVGVAAVLHAEGDLLAVWRKMGIGFRAREARQTLGVATVAAGHPDVAGVRERDLRIAHRRLPEQARTLCVREDGATEQTKDGGGIPHCIHQGGVATMLAPDPCGG